ncbi:MAG: ABC transporter substrate-binding protein [Chloroflexi bacterium]|nr:ABC transporter substrate-binding protein [Chloroflexota bacterium]
MNNERELARLMRVLTTRRSLLRGAAMGGAGLAAAALIGCGDDDDDDAPAPAAATQAATAAATEAPAATPTAAAATPVPTATATQAAVQRTPVPTATPAPPAEVARLGGGNRGEPVSGGIFRQSNSTGPQQLDPHASMDTRGKPMGEAVYGTLFRQQPAALQDHPIAEMQPGLMADWELTPDGLQLTGTLQPNAMISAPISRKLDSEDVKFSVQRFTGRPEPHSTLPSGAPNASSLDFVDTVETPDPDTPVIKMARPNPRALFDLGDLWSMVIMPREAGTAFDPGVEMVGAGAFLWDGQDPGVNYKLKRNPEWWGGPERAYVDGIEISVISGSANQLVQFKAGNLDELPRFSANELLQLRDDMPEAFIFASKRLGWSYLAFGEPRSWLGNGDAPWSDNRVRHAVSLALDRNALLEAVYNVSKLDAEGFNVSDAVSWHNMMPAGIPGQSIDPRTDEVTGKWIRHDVAESKKLLAAAGYPDGFSAEFHYTGAYGAEWRLEGELIAQIVREAGIDLKINVDDHSSVYTPMTTQGDFSGLAMILNVAPDMGLLLSLNYRLPSNRNQSQIHDPVIVDKVNDILSELDLEVRNEKIRDIQRFLVDPMWYVPSVGWQLGWGAYSPRMNVAEAHFTARGDSGYQTRYTDVWIEK